MRIKYLVATLLILTIGACQFEDADIKYNLGNDFISDDTNIIMIDTLTVNTYTILSDSLITSRANRLLTGSVINQFEIQTNCEAYLRFDPCGEQYFNTSAKYDSICFLFNLDGYQYGDTSVVGEYEVYRLSEDIVLDDESSYIYHWTQFETEPKPLGSFNVDFNNFSNQISIRFPDVLGEELFNSANKEDPDTLITDYEYFAEYFKGLVIKPVNDQFSSVIGIEAIADSTTSPRMRIYYSDFTTADDLYFDFPLASSTPSNIFAFSYIENNYTGTFLDGIMPGETKIPSTDTENISLIQRGAMLSTRIEIPYIDNLYNFGLGAIVKAELYLEPLENSFENEADLPTNLMMSLVDDENKYWQPLYSVGSEDLAAGYLNYNNDFKEETNYTYDITNYIKTEYEDFGDAKYSLMMRFPYDSSLPNVNELLIGNSKNSKNRLKLKVYLIKY